MKFLVLGCNGMAGHLISLYLTEMKHDVTGFALKQSKLVKSVTGDATNFSFLREIISTGKYDTVINCIGILNQFAEQNKSLAIILNSYLPHFLADITEKSPTQVIHMSTDCVFSGKRGQYSENDIPDGTTFYDRSKAMGELNDSKNVTLRNSIVGPDLNPRGIGLMNWFMQQDKNISGYTQAVWTGQTTLQLAKTMEIAAKERISGLYNAVPALNITKYDLLQLFNKHLRCGKLSITPIEGISADKSLRRTRFDFRYLIPDYDTMVTEAAQWIFDHKELYPHYNL